MPTFYNYTQDGQVYSIDDVFVPADAFRQGNLWGWGSNSSGQLGIFDTNDKITPVTTLLGGVDWKQVSCGGYHTAAIKTDGTLWACGANNLGQLGINAVTIRSIPVTTFAGGTNWKQVACGFNHTTAIKTDGTLWTWGNYPLGINNTTAIRTPVTTFAGETNWKQVSCGQDCTTAIKTDGTLWTWGLNQYGNLGINDTASLILTPVTTFAGGTNWKQVACGDRHTAAIKTDGTLWTWGLNNNGQLGDNTVINRSTPVTTFAGGTNWKQVSGGFSHTTAIKTDGTLWTWGLNLDGQLGDNTTINRSTPVTTFAGATNWKQVSCGQDCTTVIKTDGTLWTWGRNTNGQLGVNDGAIRSTPVTTFAGGTNWKQVSNSNGRHITATTYIDDYI